MKKIKKIQVRVTYMVGLGDVKVPNKVLDQLCEIADTSGEIDSCEPKYDEAYQWLIDNIKERDCFDHKTEIIDLEQ